MNISNEQNKEDLRLIHTHLNDIRAKTGKPLTVAQIREGLIDVLKQIHAENPKAVIGYVAGSITSDGPEYVEKNILKLEAYASHLRTQFGPHIFSTKEVFSDTDQQEITKQGEVAQVEMRRFWRDIQASGYITDLFMIPGWEKSVGARDEHDAAKETGKIKIHYVDKIVELE